MVRFIKFSALILILLVHSLPAIAKEDVGSGKMAVRSGKVADACQPATAQIDLDINNVRTRLLAGGDMWWDLRDAKYEIPKVEPGSGEPSRHSMFAGALWIGGIDAGGQLKLAAMTYRQKGNDFWPGPLDAQGSVEDVTCSAFDHHWKINREVIDEFIGYVNDNGTPVPLSAIPQSILEWPGKGNPYAVGSRSTPLNLSPSKNLAPFIDFNGDGVYNPEDGDYPDIFGDQAIWWVYNDKGDIHTESQGEAIGLEIQVMAFGFATNDEVNDMTFYKYDVLNFSTSALDSVFFGQWADPDLGYHLDDFVGCDTSRDLGICYNGTAIDGPSPIAYGANPPIIGVDFFKGPKKFLYDGNGAIEDSVILGMSLFLYYNNDFSVRGNPEVASHYYGYLSGTWKDGDPFTYGGTGKGGTIPFNFMFPDDPSDPQGWSECAIGNTPHDRRFVQASGPFRLEPGAVNDVVVGVVWTRPPSQVGCQANFDAIRLVSDKAQALFDNDFKLIDGPDAPDMVIRELDRELVISLFNDEVRNNYKETYSEVDPIIKTIVEALQDTLVTDSAYTFQGYIIYQLKDGSVSPSDFRDLERARPIAQVDWKDNIAKLVNFSFDQNMGADVPQLMVDGRNEGIRHSFRVREDAFAPGDRRLVNHKTYYYAVVAYASNIYKPYAPGDDNTQSSPYLEGRRNIKVYSGIPHQPDPHNDGTVLNASYGDIPMLMRMEGSGNGGRIMNLTPETEAEILATSFARNPVYQEKFGPVNVKVYDPVKVPDAEFELRLVDTPANRPANQFALRAPNTHWVLRNLTTGEEVQADTNISRENEQLIPQWGLSVHIKQTLEPGKDSLPNNGFLEGTKTYENPALRWLTGVQDNDAVSGAARFFNWIRSGTASTPGSFYNDYPGLDSSKSFQNILDGTFAPMALVGGLDHNVQQNPLAPMRLVVGVSPRVKQFAKLHSIDLVFTPDKSKWTRCVVLEMGDDENLNQGNKKKLALRQHPSWNKDGTYNHDTIGLSWFPGYAINIETGERLNIIFTENSWLAGDNGADMIWNPTSRQRIAAGPGGFTYVFGGMHYIFVSNTKYDGGKTFHDGFFDTNPQISEEVAIRMTLDSCIWATMSYLAPGFELRSVEEGIIPTETRVRLRVQKPYRKYDIDGNNNGEPVYRFSTQEMAPKTNVTEVAVSALDKIRVVPNPYYAYSQYERSQLDNRVKITNLPPRCTVSIYGTDGTLIRRFNRDVPSDVSDGADILSKTNLDSSLDWDLTNHKNIPVASGAYIIHVSAPGIGEKTVKFFGVMRPIDLDSF